MTSQPDTFVVIASGPSLCESDVDHVRGRAFVITANDAYQMAPWADHIYAYDLTWWQRHKPIIDVVCRGEKWTGREVTKDVFSDLRFIKTARGDARLSRDALVNGQNSGMQALTLAYVLGAKRILMLGFDMQHKGGDPHFFGKHPHGWGNADTCHKWLKYFDQIAPQFVAAGIEVINCTRDTALTCFPRMTIQDALP